MSGGFFIRCFAGGLGLGNMIGNMALGKPEMAIVGAIVLVGVLISQAIAGRK